MTTTSKDAFESNRILFTFERERDQIGTKVSFLPAFASSSASPNRKAPIGAEMPFPLPFATIATAPHAATPATASAIVFRDDAVKAPLNKGGFFSSWVLCNNGASSAREDEIAPYTFILTEGGVVTQLLLTLVVCGPAFDDDACFNNTSKARAK